MNFKNMPEIGSDHGCAASLALVILVNLAMLYCVRKKEWF